jgi:beta-glucosidase
MDEADYPFFDREATAITYGPLHGYTLLERERKTPEFAFGHGLSYTRFIYRALTVRRYAGGIEATVAVCNTGACGGDEITQLDVSFPGHAVSRPNKLLRGFERTTLQPGETRMLRFQVADEDLCYWHEASHSWQLERGDYTVHVGGSSSVLQLLTEVVSV